VAAGKSALLHQVAKSGCIRYNLAQVHDLAPSQQHLIRTAAVEKRMVAMLGHGWYKLKCLYTVPKYAAHV
jgi:hypothetical protein